ncbi:MAG: RNA methyltransferase [Kiritimatiellaeota bacterium]|nr:RNA methyltransferase [Kiritimatiellota bacterium]
MPEPIQDGPHVRNRDRDAPLFPGSLPVVIVLDRLRSAFNVGNIFRLAEAVRAERIVACGYTAVPPHPKLAKTARGCDRLVPCCHADSSATATARLRAAGRRVYGVETVDGARPVWEVDFRFPAAVVFGNEALGVDPEVLRLCDDLLVLPAFGRKNSINVANCAAVVLYTALRQWIEATRGRDKNVR